MFEFAHGVYKLTCIVSTSNPECLHLYTMSHNDSRKDAKLAKKNLCGLGVLARENVFFMPCQSEA